MVPGGPLRQMAEAFIKYADSPAVDAFGRARVSEPATIFDSKLLHGKNDLVWDEVVSNVSGDATSTHDTNRVVMLVGADVGDYVIRQTKMRFNYLPGKSHLIMMTAVIGAHTNTTKRVGYFNTSTVAPYTAEADGIWLEHDGTAAYWCIGMSGTVRRIHQTQWNKDSLLGDKYDPRAMVINFDTPQIIFIDLEWLGVGRVRCGFVHNGQYVVAHEFYNDNNTDVLTPYMDSPNHSLRYEVRSDGDVGALTEICGSVQSEGGYDLTGNIFSGSRGIVPLTTANNTLIYPLIGLRLRADRPDGTVIVFSGAILCTTTADYLWSLRINPTIAGVDAASWVDVGGNSATQVDVSRNNTNTVTGGTVIASGYVRSTNQGSTDILVELNSAVRPGVSIDGSLDEMVLCAQSLSSGVEDYYAAINWREPL